MILHEKKKLITIGVICSAVAIIYIAYRSISVLGPAGLGSFLKNEPKPVYLSCLSGEEAHEEASAPSQNVPKQYQQYLASQARKSGNLITNPTMADPDFEALAPRGYARTVENPAISYKLRYDDANKPYLHLDQTASQDLGAGWVANTVAIKKDTTYVYSFQYRSTIPVGVTLELVSAAGVHTYKAVSQLEKTSSWQTFTSYLDNAEGAVAFRFVASSKNAGSIDMKNYDIHQVASAQLSQGLVSVTFDDGWQSIADKALPILEQQHIRTTQFIITDAAKNKIPGYMNYKTITAMQKRGDEIGSHSLSHCDQEKLSSSEIAQNAQQSKKDLADQKISDVNGFAYPYGSYNDKTQAEVSKSYSFIRTSDEGYNDRYFDHQNIRSFGITSHTTDQEFQAWLDYAKQHKVWLVLVYHRVDETGEYSVSSAALKRQLQMVSNSHMMTPPMFEAARSISQSKAAN